MRFPFQRRRPPERRRTFHDAELQAAFERDGFVVTDLLDPHQVAELQAGYDSLDHLVIDDYPWVDGFATSLYHPVRSYREQVLAQAETILGPELDKLLADHQVMFANYVVKAPRADEVPLHADWTFLDESRFSSATVWCPLLDTSEELANGPLGMVVDSHRVIDFVRVANVPSYERCVEAVEGLRRAVPALRAGQAVVMDNRVVHFSLPNDTTSCRVALGCVVGPAEADLHHYWVDDDGHLLQFRLDRSFYLDYTIGQPTAASGVLDVRDVSSIAAH